MSDQRRLPRTSPERAGIGGVEQLLAAFEARGDVHSAMILRGGSVAAEAWYAPHAPSHHHRLFSVSKAFTAMAVGVGVGEGLLRTDDRVVDLLPDKLPDVVSDNLAAMRIEHLLTMTTGHAKSSMDGVGLTLSRPEDDWTRAILAEEVALEPGSQFVYDTGATYLLSVILHRLTGERLLDWLTPRLFEPLGITGATWEQDRDGIDVGGFGLSLRTEDMAAFGQLLLQRGRWGDAQLIPAEWVDRAGRPLVEAHPQGWDPDWAQGYGYQLWGCRNRAYRADGAFGQFIIVWPEHDAVIAITSGSSATQGILDLIWSTLEFGEPGEGGETFAPALSLPLPEGSATSPRENDGPLRRVGDVLEITHRGTTLRAWHGQWLIDGAFGAAFAWADDDTLRVTAHMLGTPFSWSGTATFGPASVELAWSQNVIFSGDTAWAESLPL
ncbi:serine hydrolase domain-containing protein [Microbacterium phosphatis]|uniref:serine hydrolase domain-containing protein n=1 Tax=Microbacterium phosphatis TaxID=3140248 RepID=UPI003140788C